ncbi:uncharacterized [Tachysurus ichikawai]
MASLREITNLVASCAPELHADLDSPTYCTEHSSEAVGWRPKQSSKPCSTVSPIGRLTVLSSLQEPTGWLPVLNSHQRQMEQSPKQSSKSWPNGFSTELQNTFTLGGSLQSPEADGATSKAELEAPFHGKADILASILPADLQMSFHNEADREAHIAEFSPKANKVASSTELTPGVDWQLPQLSSLQRETVCPPAQISPGPDLAAYSFELCSTQIPLQRPKGWPQALS